MPPPLTPPTAGDIVRASFGIEVVEAINDHEERIDDLEAVIGSPGGGGASDLDDLTDVTIASVTPNDVLQYNGSSWVNQPAASLNASNLSTGTLPAARLPALTGDVTSSAGSAATTIANDAVTYAQMQNVAAASRLLGRGSSGAGDPQEITLGTNLSMAGTTLNVTPAGGGTPALDDLTDVAITSATNGDVLQYDGAEWVNTPAAAAGAPADAQYVALATNGTLTNERVLTGTANQITVTDGGAGSTVTLSTPQNLHTGATPQFARMGLGVAADANVGLKLDGLQYGSLTEDKGNSGTSLTVNWNDGNTQLITLTGNCTLTLSNPIDGGRYLLVLEQDGTGSRTVTWPSTVKWPAGAAPTLTTTAGDCDIVTLVWIAGIGASGNYLAAANLDYTPA